MDGTPASRGRARARSRARGNLPPAASGSPEQPTPGQGTPPPPSQEVYTHMYGLREKRHSDGSDGSGNGTNGNGNGTSGSNGDNGHSNGNGGNGNGSNGENGNGRGRGSPLESRGGSPRGMSPRQAGSQLETGPSVALDYIVSRPSHDFVKKVTPQQGGALTVATNYYHFRTHPKWNLSLYVVKIEPLVEDERKVRKLVAQNREKIGSYILTGFQLFTTRPVNPDITVFQVQWEDDPNLYTVELQFRRAVENSEPLVFQFYNSVVRRIQTLMEYQLIGRHYFEPRQARDFPAFRLRLWPGFQNSIRQQESGLMLNVESVWKVLQTDSILVQIENIKRQNTDKEQAKRAINDALKGTMVVTTYGQRSKVYKIDHVDFNASPMSTFPTKDGDMVYVNYYKQRYDVDISDKRQFMLVSLPKERDRRRGQTGDIYLVPELCYPCGLNDTLRSNFKLMKEIAVCLHMSPTERVHTMNRFIAGAASNPQIVETLKNWGIKIPLVQPVELTARVLKPDDIQMANNQVAKPDDKADWTMGLRGKRMLQSMSLVKWVLIITNRDSANVSHLISTMQKVATPLGYNISQPTLLRVNDARGLAQGVTDAMNQAKGQLDFLMIILANNNADIYAAVKKRCSIEYGIPSQCFLAKNIGSKGLMSIATKVVIQMNAKQGGLPWGVSNPMKKMKLMVLGFDVHHAGPAGGDSVAAMTATMDETLGSYYSCVSNALQRSEVGTLVASLFTECLKAYFKKNKCLPEKIIMYRDGVGEGQLNQVYDIEVKAFKDSIASAYARKKSNLPKLTFIVVNKRISTRFFQRVGQEKFDNPKPGLVVDDVVTRPERYDFFLVSQTARQGCVSPTYYNVLVEEDQLGPDKLQRFTYKMCHLYYNWSGTVAVPAPCQNAHKLAFLVGTALKRPAHSDLAYQLHFL